MHGVELLRHHGQSVWYDNIDRELIRSGELTRLIESGVSGVTTNPTIFDRAINQSSAYDEDIRDMARQGLPVEKVYDALTMRDVTEAAMILRPVYDASEGKDGYVSLEVSPHLADDAHGTIREAKRLFHELACPNVMIKVPATTAGITAVRSLIRDGVNVNVTLIFGLSNYEQVIDAYLTGLEERFEQGLPIHQVASVASFFISRVDTLVDRWILERGMDIDFCGKAAIANAILAYKKFLDSFQSQRFSRLKEAGAKSQRPLWASTGVKNPAYPDLMYVNALIAPDTVTTVPPATLDVILRGEIPVDRPVFDYEASDTHLKILEQRGISMQEVADCLLREGVAIFKHSFDHLLNQLGEKIALSQ
ncbi:MAG: transaldolase [Alicyclobacillus sp.]|nr:transaldolase [Alicyclobacillus sp.]